MVCIEDWNRLALTGSGRDVLYYAAVLEERTAMVQRHSYPPIRWFLLRWTDEMGWDRVGRL